MKYRNPLVVLLLSLVTFGIYDIYWLVKTKKDLNNKTKLHIPTIWLLFGPPVAIAVFSVGGTLIRLTIYHSNTLVLLVTALDILALTVIVPISFYWYLKFSQSVNEYTDGKLNTGLTFILLWILHMIGIAVVQEGINELLATESSSESTATAFSSNETTQDYIKPTTNETALMPETAIAVIPYPQAIVNNPSLNLPVKNELGLSEQSLSNQPLEPINNQIEAAGNSTSLNSEHSSLSNPDQDNQ